MLVPKQHENCRKCPLRDQPFVQGEGAKPCRLMILGEAPGKNEAEQGRPFVGLSGNVLDSQFELLGIRRGEVAFTTNVVKCRPPNNDLKSSKAAISLCRVFLEDEFKRVQPRAVVPLGKYAINAIEGGDHAVSARVATAVVLEGGLASVPSYHPSFILRRNKNEYELGMLREAIRIACGFAGIKTNNGIVVVKERKYTLLNNMSLLNAWYTHVKNNPAIKKLSFDIESEDLNYDSFELGIGFGYGPGKAVYIPLKVARQIQRRSLTSSATTNAKKKPILKDFWPDPAPVMAIIKDLLTSGEFKLCAHNGTYELTKLLHPEHYPERMLDFSDNYAFDSRYGYFLINENGLNGLDVLSSRYPDLHGYKKESKGYDNFANMPMTVLANRCMADCDATYRLSDEIASEIKRQGLSFMMYEWMLPVATVLSNMQRWGIKIDVDYINGIIEQKTEEVAAIDEKIMSYPEVEALKSRLGTKALNLNSGDQKAILLYEICGIEIPMMAQKGGELVEAKTKGDTGKTDKDTLKLIKEKHPLAKLLLDRSHPAYMITTMKSWLEVAYPDGRVRTNFNLAIAVTGRLSSGLDKRESSASQKVVNLQNVSRDKVMRRTFVAEKDYVLFDMDVAQSEVWWWFVQSHDDVGLDGYALGHDTHSANLAAVWKVKPHPKYGSPSVEEVVRLYKLGDPIVYEARSRIKNTVTFGVLFGMSDKTLEAAYGIPQQEAKMLKNLIFSTFVKGAVWREDRMEAVGKEGKAISVYGRIRHLPDVHSDSSEVRSAAIRQGFNFYMQSASSDMNCLYIAWLFEEIMRQGLIKVIRPVLTVHDSIIFEVHKDFVIPAYGIIKDITSIKPHEICPYPPRFDIDLNKAWTQKAHIHIKGADGFCICGNKDLPTYDLLHADIDPSLPKDFYCKSCIGA